MTDVFFTLESYIVKTQRFSAETVASMFSGEIDKLSTKPSVKFQSELVEDLLTGRMVRNPIFLTHKQNLFLGEATVYAYHQFFNNQLALADLPLLPQFNGFYFRDFGYQDATRLLESKIHVHSLRFLDDYKLKQLHRTITTRLARNIK